MHTFFWKQLGCALIGACALIRTITVYTFVPQYFYCIKVSFLGVYISRTCYHDAAHLIPGSRLGGSYLDGTTRSELLRNLESSTDTESLASTGKYYSDLFLFDYDFTYQSTIFQPCRNIATFTLGSFVSLLKDTTCWM